MAVKNQYFQCHVGIMKIKKEILILRHLSLHIKDYFGYGA